MKSRKVLVGAGLVLAALLSGGAAVWRWYARVTTPPLQLEVAPGSVAAPAGARLAAEWEPASGVLIAWPLRLPRDLVVALAARVRLYVTVADEDSAADAASALESWGVARDAGTFIVAPQGDGWYGTRDWGPFAVFDNAGRCQLVDARYVDYPVSDAGEDETIYWLSKLENLNFAADDVAPAAVANALGLPRVEFPYALTGGAVETDGLGTAFVTEAVIQENEALGVSKDRLFEAAQSVLGIERFIVVPNYEDMGVHHIDCALKLLDAERILVKRPPGDHPQYRRVQKIVGALEAARTRAGRRYEILRMDTPRYHDDELANYINALILNGAVFVPLFGIPADEEALATWQRAMPDHEVLGFEYPGEDGWTYTDALHCRTKTVWKGCE